MHVAMYLRQSLDTTGLQAAVTRQRQDCATICNTRGWTWTEYIDNDISATTNKPRPAYQTMLQAIRDNKAQGIICWHTDRLYRKLADLQELIDLCQQHNTPITTAQAGELDLSSDAGRLVARILGSVSMAEIERKSARHKSSLKQRAEQGRHWWIQRPFGYNKTLDENGQPGAAELHPTEAPLIREAYEKVLNGVSCHSIQQQWNKQGITTSTGAQWRNQRLRQLLINPRNAGLRTHNGRIIDTKEEKWPQIVPEDIYQAVKHILENPERDLFTKNGRARKHLLVGIAKCGKCGHTVRSGQSRRGKHQYVCHNCYGIGREMQLIDKAITTLIANMLTHPDAQKLLHKPGIDTQKLRNDAATLRKRKTKARDDYKREVIDGDLYQETTDELNQQLADIEARMYDANKARIYQGVIGAKDVHAAFLDRPLDQQRAIIAAHLNIEIHPGHRGKPLTEAILPDILKAEWKEPA